MAIIVLSVSRGAVYRALRTLSSVSEKTIQVKGLEGVGAVCVACVLVSALALRVVFYMTGISIYPFF